MKKLAFLWSNTHQLYYMLGNIDSYRKYSDVPFNRAESVFQVSHGNRMSCYIGVEDLERHEEEGAIFLDPTIARTYLDAAWAQCDAHKKFFRELESCDLASLSDGELLGWWRGIIDHYSHSAAYFRSTQDEPSRKIVSAVTASVSGADAQTLLLSPRLDEINKESIAWEALMVHGFTGELAREHLRSFPWLFQNALSYDDAVKELKQRAEGHEVHDTAAEKNSLNRRQTTILANHPEITQYVLTLQELALLRPAVKAAWGSTGYFALPLLTEIASRRHVDLPSLVFLYRSEDIDALIEEGHVLSPEEIQNRRLGTAYQWEGGKLLSFVGEDVVRMEAEMLGAVKTGVDVNELKGVCARPGSVHGRVYVLAVNDPAATKEFRNSFTGGVLVTSMTQPNVVDIARKASAIVTDEGGMLCHAAIISREFGIPCVVGTKIGTHFLRDGDIVEVDADAGVVTIIEKAP